MSRKNNSTTFKNYQPDEILWNDTRRWLGMPITLTRYSVDKNRFYVRTGLFKTMIDETLLYRILDIKLSRTLWQKMFGVGTVTLYCTDKTNPTIEIKNIKDADKLRVFLSSVIEERRKDQGVVGREIMGTGGPIMDRDGDGIPDAPPPEHFLNGNGR